MTHSPAALRPAVGASVRSALAAVPAQVTPPRHSRSQTSSSRGVLRSREALLLDAVAGTSRLARVSLPTFCLGARHGTGMLRLAGAAGAVRQIRDAYREVPAYQEFIDANGGLPRRPRGMGAQEWLSLVPTTSKRTYIDPYTLAERCTGGVLPTLGTELDESSGSSGKPYQWARSQEELTQVHRTLALLSRYLLGEGREVVTLNAFSMGAWSTGVNVSMAMRSVGALKSCGPETDKVLDALAVYGSAPRYAVCGYPPFLRQLTARATERGIDLSAYDLVGFVGGEGMGEGLRAELEETFSRVWSAYGASDLDIGVAAETPISVWLRQRANENPALAQALFGSTSRLPMVFQYDPSTYHIETVSGEHGTELVMTVLRRTLTPKLRYRVGDSGGTMSLEAALALAEEHGYTPGEELAEWGVMFSLPLLFLHGRADSTISFMGANLYPEDVAAGIEDARSFVTQRLTELRSTASLGAFALELRGDTSPRPVIHVEFDVSGIADADTHQLRGYLIETLRTRLARNSDDYRAALLENPDASDLRVEFHAPGTNVFAANTTRIKQQYFV